MRKASSAVSSPTTKGAGWTWTTASSTAPCRGLGVGTNRDGSAGAAAEAAVAASNRKATSPPGLGRRKAPDSAATDSCYLTTFAMPGTPSWASRREGLWPNSSVPRYRPRLRHCPSSSRPAIAGFSGAPAICSQTASGPLLGGGVLERDEPGRKKRLASKPDAPLSLSEREKEITETALPKRYSSVREPLIVNKTAASNDASLLVLLCTPVSAGSRRRRDAPRSRRRPLGGGGNRASRAIVTASRLLVRASTNKGKQMLEKREQASVIHNHRSHPRRCSTKSECEDDRRQSTAKQTTPSQGSSD